MASVFASQLTSIVTEGVFDQFPATRIALLESGFTWLPSHMWRFDKEWRNLRALVPWVKQAPSAYIRQHVRLTVQPLDSPPSLAHMQEIIEQLGSEEMLLYASDYPHVHYADTRTWVADLPSAQAARIGHENARSWYKL